MGGGDLHLVVDEPGSGVEEPTEQAGEAEDIVDLVRVIRAARGHHPHVALDLFRLDLGHGVRHGEDDALAGHALDVARGEHARHREPDEHVGALDGVRHLALDVLGIRGARHPGLHEVHAHRAPAVEGPVLVDADDVPGAEGE